MKLECKQNHNGRKIIPRSSSQIKTCSSRIRQANRMYKILLMENSLRSPLNQSLTCLEMFQKWKILRKQVQQRGLPISQINSQASWTLAVDLENLASTLHLELVVIHMALRWECKDIKSQWSFSIVLRIKLISTLIIGLRR